MIDHEGTQVGVVPLGEGLKIAEENELDLVEVAPEADPPVCRIEDYKKIVYQKKRQMRDARKKQHQTEMKEVRIRPNCDQHDFETKMRKAQGFIDKGHKLKITMMFRGREIATKRDRQEDIKQRVMDMLGEQVDIEALSSSNARTTVMILAPKKTASK